MLEPGHVYEYVKAMKMSKGNKFVKSDFSQQDNNNLTKAKCQNMQRMLAYYSNRRIKRVIDPKKKIAWSYK